MGQEPNNTYLRQVEKDLNDSEVVQSLREQFGKQTFLPLREIPFQPLRETQQVTIKFLREED